MEMTEQEIVKRYKAADKKRAQITILAELNGCPRATIREILQSHGCEVPKTGNRFTAKAKETPQDELKEEFQMAGGVITIEDPGKRMFGESLAISRQPKKVKTPESVLLLVENEALRLQREIEEMESVLATKKLDREELVNWLNSAKGES